MESNDTSFQIDDTNTLLQAAFSAGNYEIINGTARNGLCLIFCSSNGIFYPDTNGSFRKSIICSNRYEWRRTASYVIDYAEKIILIRDIHKCWYSSGVNADIDDIDKLASFLRKICDGYRVVIAGSSAGGYIASILGYMLNAHFVLNWSGQCNLWDHNGVTENIYFMRKYAKDLSRSRYYDLRQVLEDSKVPIYYFYPIHCGHDSVQAKYWHDIPNVMVFALDSYVHGVKVSTKGHFSLLLSKNIELLGLYGKKDKIISIDDLEKEVSYLPAANLYHEYESHIMSDNKAAFYRDMLLKWLAIRQTGRNLFWGSQFDHLKTFAIYGRGDFFSLLKRELVEAEKKIECIVESWPRSSKYEGYAVKNVKELGATLDIDAVVIIPCYDKDRIRSLVEDSRFSGVLLWLNDLLDEDV